MEYVTKALVLFIGLFVVGIQAVPLKANEFTQSVFDVNEKLGLNLLNLGGSTKEFERWSFSFENDFLVPGGKDQDYTYGFSGSYVGTDLKDNFFTRSRKLGDELLGIESNLIQRRSMEVGLYAFTPAEPREEVKDAQDRPFASLVYVSTGADRVSPRNKTVLRSQLTFGVLGLNIAAELQSMTHQLLDSAEEVGWNRQISDGGEPTFRYSLSKQQLLGELGNNYELKHTRSISLGYITEASWGLSFRAGDIQSAWYGFSPEVATYAESSVKTQKEYRESYFWAGVAVKARAYNAFLQGQFKHSPVTFDSDELNHFLVEAWLGYTHGFKNGFYFSYGLRGHSSEVRHGVANRSVVWGGLMIGKRIH
ncbi:lipid A-modifier LpxR family protein [Teredinibacter sp. KSP-S5-2]|uniref:lipid A-modifier LpxR family protein n=1 Tax=Teredinibacter sp. KSP-S5-2 TaxID=3034506 RepID=UPI002934E5CC|nr:lipid A-modifier LpxR family protein [Teredinibacter sp. KSP-S5-2]WNO09304.1 DUF2219 family protein [Teredinibacter sp. KSP-S5-2]